MADEKESYSISMATKALEKDIARAMHLMDKLGANAVENGKIIDESLRPKPEKIQADVNKAKKQFSDLAKHAQKEGNEIQKTLMNVGKMVGSYFAVAQLQEFASAIVNVRSEMQSYEISFATLLGDEKKAGDFFSQIKQYAVNTPMMLKDLANGAQTMLAFNIEAEKVIPTLKQIGDVSMGDSQKFQSLTLAFSQMSATGKLMGQDLLQMINAGFNPLNEISKKTGKSMEVLKDEMSAGKITADMVAEAFASATSEGGMFFGMLEKQSKGLAGAISNLKGAIEDVMNTLGEASEGVIASSISGMTTLVKNYDVLGKALISIATTYGTYRAAVMMVTVAESKHTLAHIASVRAMQMARVAQRALNATVLANPYVLAATALGALISATFLYATKTAGAEKAQKDFNQSLEDQKANYEKQRQDTEQAIAAIKDETRAIGDKSEAMQYLKDTYPEIFTNMDIEKVKLASELDLRKQINEEIQKGTAEKAKDAVTEAQAEVDRARSNVNYYVNHPGGADSAMVLHNARQRLVEAEQRLRLAKERNSKVQEEMRQQEEEAKKEPVHNKKYWENMKEAAQTELEALSDIEANGRKGAELKKKIAEYDTLLGAFSTNGKAEKSANKEKVREAELAQKKADAEKALARSARDNAFDIRQAEIEGMEEGFRKEEASMKLAYDRLIAANEDRKEKMIKDLQEVERAEWEKKNPNADEKGLFFVPTISQVTPEMQAQLDEYARIANEMRGKFYNDQAKKEQEAMNEFLVQYGDYQQKRLATAERYQAQIARAGTDAEKKILQKQMEEALADLDIEALRKSIDWDAVFGDLSKVTNTQLKIVLRQLKDFSKSKEFRKNATVEQQKVVSEAIKSLTEEAEARSPFTALADSMEEYGKALVELKYAQLDYEAALASGTEAEIENTKAILDKAKAQKEVASLKNAKAIGDIANDLGRYAQAVGQVESLFESFKDIDSNGGVSGVIGGISDALGGLSQAWQSLLKMDIAGVIGGIAGIVGGVVTTIANAGGILHVFSSADYKDYNEMKAQYQNLSSLWDELIGKKAEYIGMSFGPEAQKATDDVLALIARQEQAARELARARARSGASTGSHSIGVRQNAWMTKSDWSEAQKVLGSGFVDASQLIDLTAEQLKNFKENAPTFWAKLDNDFRGYLEDIINASEQASNAIDAMKEQLTQVSFDGMYSNFLDKLMDMESSAKDFSNDLSQDLARAFLAQSIGSKFKDRLQSWYDTWANDMNDGALSQSEIEALRSQYQQMVNEAIAERDRIAEITGYGKASSQDSTKMGITSMSQDTADELNGRFTAMQVALEEVHFDSGRILGSVEGMAALQREHLGIAQEHTNLLILGNEHLAKIAKNTNELALMNERLQQIERNTR